MTKKEIYNDLKEDISLVLGILNDYHELEQKDFKFNNSLIERERVTTDTKINELTETLKNLIATFDKFNDVYRSDMENCSKVINAIIEHLQLDFKEELVDDPAYCKPETPKIKKIVCEKRKNKKGNKR